MTSPFPNPPLVNPPAVFGYWLVLAHVAEWGDAQSVLWFLTDAPVQLYMQFTEDPPSARPRFGRRRGVTKMVSTFWHMNPGRWAPQREAGDTYVHSWAFSGWPEGAPLWYFLDGTQQGRKTVSSSILFGSVRPVTNLVTNPLGDLSIRLNLSLRLDQSAWSQEPAALVP